MPQNPEYSICFPVNLFTGYKHHGSLIDNPFAINSEVFCCFFRFQWQKTESLPAVVPGDESYGIVAKLTCPVKKYNVFVNSRILHILIYDRMNSVILHCI